MKDLRQKFTAARERTMRLSSCIDREAMVIQVAEFVSPPKWHLGHTTWFFETFILRPLQGYRVFNEKYDFLFNSYYETLGKRLVRNGRGVLFQPPVEDIIAYREHVDKAVLAHFDRLDEKALQILETGINHEEQHQELLITDTKYLYAQHPLLPAIGKSWGEQIVPAEAELSWLSVDEGVYTIGHQGSDFCYDNELGVHKQYVHALEIMSRPVTNGEYLEFIKAGGYTDFRYWLSEGWEWVNRSGAAAPMYWYMQEDQSYMFFGFEGLQPLDLSAPLCHINYFEAEAYAHWKGMSLPTEFEWEVAATKHPENFTNQVWEWTKSAYLPYPGFTIAPGAIGEYNGKFMVSQMVLRGGSIATPPGHSRITYRNFFHPHLQWQFSGVRLVRGTS